MASFCGHMFAIEQERRMWSHLGTGLLRERIGPPFRYGSERARIAAARERPLRGGTLGAMSSRNGREAEGPHLGTKLAPAVA
jgi:hypothetical protein